ncbi:coat protein [Cucumber Bulgarian latent virus]|uniref:Capsid protein n=1 Tax=Cucumber Bulgarian latent virus TaxID=2560401 RepID=Q80R14_9TOMB|nr:coat protein [Cucumber Bulgarian latent virus]AAO33941.1 coat protein [Cucumber Bulgarian latent virus]
MALVLRKAGNIVPYVGPAAKAGATAVYNNRKIIYDGLNWIYAKVSKRVKKKNGIMSNVVGASPGSIVAPVATSRQLRASRPKFMRTRGGVNITHREYVTQVNGVNGGTFQLNRTFGPGAYRVNPTNAAVFPWLLNIASNFDKYKFTRLSFHYVPMCATTEVGRVGLFFDRDSEDSGPFDRSEVANMAHLAETPPWGEVVLQVPCDSIDRFISDSTVTDTKLIDLGRFGYVVYGGSTNNAYGDVFVQYTVELREPQPSSNTMEEITGNAGNSVVTTPPSYFRLASFDATLAAFTPTTAGTYLVTLILEGTAMTAGNISTSNPSALTITGQSVVVSATKVIYVCQVIASTPGHNLNFNFTAASATFWNFFAVRTTRDIIISA